MNAASWYAVPGSSIRSSKARFVHSPAVLSTLVNGLFDSEVAAAELREPGDPALLYPSEAAASARFAPMRRAEFAAGRLCARRALHELGFAHFALEVNTDRSPRWPPGIVGSITHTAGFCAAAVAPAQRFAGIGIDAETIGRITPEMRHLIFTADELALFASRGAHDRAALETAIFSAKEAFYKCQFPLTGAWRDFTDVRLVFDRHEDITNGFGRGGRFTIYPSHDSAITDWGLRMPQAGRAARDGERVVTAVATRRLDFE